LLKNNTILLFASNQRFFFVPLTALGLLFAHPFFERLSFDVLVVRLFIEDDFELFFIDLRSYEYIAL